MTRENEPAAEQAHDAEATREEHDPVTRHEGEPASEQARDEERRHDGR